MTCLNRVSIDVARATVIVWHVEDVHLLNPFQRKMAAMNRKLRARMKERLAHVEAH